MMSKRVNIADVAREAGVSAQTVSRALNNKGEISAETRERVLETVERLPAQHPGPRPGDPEDLHPWPRRARYRQSIFLRSRARR